MAQHRGELTLSVEDREGVFYRMPVYAATDVQLPEHLGGLREPDGATEAPGNQPDFFFHPQHVMTPVEVDGDVPQLAIGYDDNLRKGYPLAFGYRLYILVAYVKKNPDVERIADPTIRKEIYERAVRQKLLGFTRRPAGMEGV